MRLTVTEQMSANIINHMKDLTTDINEDDRLRDLESFKIIDQDEEDDYDFVTSMAARICGTKISLISLVTDDKQWFLSHYGLETRETPKEYSFCGHAIKTPHQPFIIEDARKDYRFSNNPLTTGEPHVIFYAGIPLVSKNGFALGSLCVIDDSPRHLSAEQIQQLQQLARQTITILELRRSQREIKEINNQLNKKNLLFTITEEANQIGTWELDIQSGETFWSKVVYEIHEVPLDFNHNRANAIEFYHPDYRNLLINSLQNAIDNSEPFDVECILTTARGNHKWVKSTGRKIGCKVIGSFQDITEIKQNELKFKGIFNSTFSFIGFLNTEGILLEANDTALSMASLKHKDVIGKYFWDCYWWQISQQAQEELKHNFQKAVTGQSVTYEVAVWTANRIPVTLLFSMKPIFNDEGKVIYIVPEGRPVQELVDARRKYKSVIEGTNVGTWEWNVQTGETMFNDRWATIVGYTLEELAPISIDTWMKLAHPDDLEESGRRLRRCFERKSEYYEMEVRMKHKDGHWIWVYDRGKVFEWTEEGKPSIMYGTHQDISERKQKEESLRISEEAFRGNFENAGVGMALLDEAGKWLKVNAKLCEIIGYSENELVRLTFQDITHPDDLDADLSLLKELMEGERNHYQMEKRYFHKNGNVVHAILAVSMVRDKEGKVLYFVSQIIDITQSKNQSLALSYQQDLLASLYDLSPIGIALNDFETGKFVDANGKLLESTGYSKNEFLSLSYWEITPREYDGIEAIALGQMEETGKYEVFEKEYIRKDGSRYPVALRGVVVDDLKGKKLIWSFVQDISKEKEAEKKLNEAIAKLKGVLNASTQVSIIATDLNGTITLFNTGAEEMLGYKAEAVIGVKTPQLIHSEDEMLAKGKSLSAQYGEEITGFDIFVHEAKIGKSSTNEWTYKNSNGASIPVLLSVTAVRDQDCGISGFLGVATDISEPKRVQNEINALLKITSEQNQRLSNFAHIVSHNLRSHSTGIIGILEIMAEEESTIAQTELFNLLQWGAKNLAQTVEDLTEVVKVNLGSDLGKDINLYDIIQKNIVSLSSQIKNSKIAIINKISHDTTVNCVPAYLDSIILNFVTNAIKYKSEERESYLKIEAGVSDQFLILSFQDNGLGIDLKMHGDKVFGMYKTFHKHDDARGVGLFITKNQIESMGGKIDIESELNVGTTFKIYFKNEKN